MIKIPPSHRLRLTRKRYSPSRRSIVSLEVIVVLVLTNTLVYGWLLWATSSPP